MQSKLHNNEDELFRKCNRGNTLIIAGTGYGKTMLMSMLAECSCGIQSKTLIIYDKEKVYPILLRKTNESGNNGLLKIKRFRYRYGKEKEIFDSMNGFIEESISEGVTDIFIEDVPGRIFLTYIDMFEKYYDRIHFTAASLPDFELLEKNVLHENFSNIFIGKMPMRDKERIRKALKIEKPLTRNNAGDFYLYSKESGSIEYVFLEENNFLNRDSLHQLSLF